MGDIEILYHAWERMQVQLINIRTVEEVLAGPDSVVESRFGRKIYQKEIGGYLIRVVVEEHNNIKRVITVYKTHSGRYEV